MLATAALLCLGSIDPSHFAGALTEEQDLAEVPVSQLTRDQLLVERARLEPARTGFIAPIVLTAVGGVLVIGGAAFTVVGIFYIYLPSLFGFATGMTMSIFTAVGAVLAVIGGAALIAGGILLTIGLVKLFPALARRREASDRLEEVNKRLQQLEAPPENTAPMNPGDVRREGPVPSLVLATF